MFPTQQMHIAAEEAKREGTHRVEKIQEKAEHARKQMEEKQACVPSLSHTLSAPHLTCKDWLSLWSVWK